MGISVFPGGLRKIGRRQPEYPSLLDEISDPPEFIYAGGKPLEAGPAVAVVGTRRASQYGLETAKWVGRELAASGITVVSGLAKGIDAAAHWGALEAGGTTVAVLGCGLDICYPRHNKDLYDKIAEEGTLISEYEPGTPAIPRNFPCRNRIIAGMTLGAVIVEARPKGGALITARLAMEFSREVFAIPGPVHAPGSWGSHSLVRDGARLVTCADDILEDLGMLRSPSSSKDTSSLDPDESRIVASLEAQPLVLDLIARRSKMPASTAGSVLVRLELRGLVSRHPGGRFALPVA